MLKSVDTDMLEVFFLKKGDFVDLNYSVTLGCRDTWQ